MRPIPEKELRYAFLLLSAFAISAAVVFFEVEVVLWIPILLGAGLGLAGWFLCAVNPRLFTVPAIFSSSLLFAYFFGYLLYLIGGWLTSQEGVPDWFIETYGSVQDGWIAAATLLVFSVSLLLRIAGWFVPPMCGFLQRTWRTSGFDMAVLWTCVAVVIAAYVSGSVGYRGIHPGPGGQLSGLGAFAATIAVPLTAAAFYVGLSSRGWHRIQSFLVFMIAELLLVPLGRREVFFSLLLVAFVLAVRYQHRRWGVMSRLRVAAVAAIAIVFVALPAFVGFYALRAFENTSGVDRAQTRDFSVMARGALSTLKGDSAEVATGLASNIGPRAGSLLAYLGDNIDRHHDLSGDVAILSLQMAIPARVWPEKQKLLDEYDGVSESIIHPALGLPVFDGPNSILTEGFADFGWVGAASYALAVALIYGLIGAGLRFARVDAGSLLIGGAILYSMLSVEKTLAGYVADLRHVVMLIVAYGVLVLIFRTLRRISRSQRMPVVSASIPGNLRTT